MGKVEDIFLKNLPTIDLHGYDRDSAAVLTNDFVRDNVFLGNFKIVIIHGIGEGILKKKVHEVLSHNKNVSSYHLDGFNIGRTVVYLKNK